MSAPRTDPPTSLRHLIRMVDDLARSQGRRPRRVQRAVANTVVGQMLPSGVVKGGTAMELRVGEAGSRFTPDLDTAPGPVHADEWLLESYGNPCDVVPVAGKQGARPRGEIGP